jgi:magnesium transporter
VLTRPERPVRETPAISGDHESRCIVFTGDGAPRALKDASEISDLLQDEKNFVWLDLAEPTPADLELLKEEFALHPMAVEDAALSHERPKIEAFERYWLVVVHGATLGANGRRLHHEIAIFVGSNFVVTIRAHPEFPLDEIERRWLSKDGVPHTATGLLYVILDVVVDGYHPVAAAYNDRLLALENRVLDEKQDPRNTLRDVLLFKRELIQFRHDVAPIRDILAPVLRGDLAPLETSVLAYFRDVYDHAARALEQVDSIRDLLNSTLDIHLSSQAHRQGEVAKQLTVIATIFLPLSYITGFFGQNFGWMIGHIDKAEHFWFLGVGTEVFALIVLFAYFAYKRWV